MTGKPLDADTLALLAWCARTRAKLRHYERSGGPMPTTKQVFQDCEDDERREAAEIAYTAAKRRAGRASALARARRKANPQPVSSTYWRGSVCANSRPSMHRPVRAKEVAGGKGLACPPPADSGTDAPQAGKRSTRAANAWKHFHGSKEVHHAVERDRAARIAQTTPFTEWSDPCSLDVSMGARRARRQGRETLRIVGIFARLLSERAVARGEEPPRFDTPAWRRLVSLLADLEPVPDGAGQREIASLADRRRK